MSSSNYTATNVITQAFLDITQTTSQSVNTKQLIDINCFSNKSSELCLECVKDWKEISQKHPSKTMDNEKFIKKMCEPVCSCKIEKINMDNVITVNFEAWKSFNSSEAFVTKVLDSINQSAYQEKKGIFATPDRSKNTQETITNIYNAMKSQSFQDSLQTLNSQQILNVKGPSNIYDIDLNQFTDYFSVILQTNDQTSSLIGDLDKNMVQLTTQVTNAGLSELISWIVRIVIALLILIIFIYAINLIIQIYSLYV